MACWCTNSMCLRKSRSAWCTQDGWLRQAARAPAVVFKAFECRCQPVGRTFHVDQMEVREQDG